MRGIAKFPVGVNVPTVLSHCKYLSKEGLIIITHKTKVPDPRVAMGKPAKHEDGKIWVRTKSFIHIPKEDNAADWLEFDRHIRHVCDVLDIDMKKIYQLERSGQHVSFADAVLNKLGTSYYLKTIVFPDGSGVTRTYPSRKIPYMSKKPDLFYRAGEEKQTFIKA